MNDTAQGASATPPNADQGLPDDEISLLDLLQVVADNLRLLLLGPLAVGLAALGVSFLLTPTFTAKTQFLPPQQQQSAAASMIASLGSLGGLAGAAAGLKNPADQYVAFLKSVSVQDALIERFKLVDYYELKTKTDARARLGGVRIASGKDGLISVEVDDRDPKFAADLANAYPEELQRLLARLAVTEAQSRRLFFEKQLATARDNLTKSEQALKATGVNSSALKSNPAAAVEAVARLRAGISAQEVKIAGMRGYLTDASPAMKQALTELIALRDQLAKAERDLSFTVIRAPFNGVIGNRAMQVGDYVQPGQRLFLIKCSDWRREQRQWQRPLCVVDGRRLELDDDNLRFLAGEQGADVGAGQRRPDRVREPALRLEGRRRGD